MFNLSLLSSRHLSVRGLFALVTLSSPSGLRVVFRAPGPLSLGQVRYWRGFCMPVHAPGMLHSRAVRNWGDPGKCSFSPPYVPDTSLREGSVFWTRPDSSGPRVASPRPSFFLRQVGARGFCASSHPGGRQARAVRNGGSRRSSAGRSPP